MTNIALGVRILGIITSVSPSMIFRMLLDLGFPDGNSGRHCYLTCDILIWFILMWWYILEKISFPKGYPHSFVPTLVISVRLKGAPCFGSAVPCAYCTRSREHRQTKFPPGHLIPRKNTNEWDVKRTQIQDLGVLVSALPWSIWGVGNSHLFLPI